MDIDEMDIIVQFAKLWGIETADSRTNENRYYQMESYDSTELVQLFIGWRDEYMIDISADDSVEFFYKKFNELIKTE